MKSYKTLLLAFAVATAGLMVVAQDAQAKRLGGGLSKGTQSSNVTQKQAPAAPTQAAKPAAPAATPAPAPAPARNRWLGPLAGLAAGLGIAALLSHLGMGGAMAEMLGSFLMIAGVALAAMFLWRMWRARQEQAAGLSPALAGAGNPTAFGGANDGSNGGVQAPAAFTAIGGAAGAVGAAGAAGAIAGADAAPVTNGTWTIPAGFDTNDFLHIAKMYFVRMQAAWDARDEGDIRTFTTPEMFAEIKLDLVARGDAQNQTDVVSLDAEMLGVEEIGDKTMASVRLSGMIRETVGGPAEPFREVWNLVKPASARASWVLAGIQQE